MALAALVFTSAAGAQPAALRPAGVLGQRHAELSGGYADLYGIFEDAKTGRARLNLPVHANVDLGFAYTHWRGAYEHGGGTLFSAGPYTVKLREHTISAGAAAYLPLKAAKPFLTASLGHARITEKIIGSRFDDSERSGSETLWTFGAGIEVAISAVTITPRIDYQDTSGAGDDGAWTYGGEAHWWFAPSLGVFAQAARVNPGGYARSANAYHAGIRLRF